jgi:hypothetical protein
MKNHNLLTNHFSKIGKILFQHIFKPTSARIFLAFCIPLLVIRVSAQEVRELNSILSENNVETNQIRSLINDLQPALYYQQGSLISDKVETPLLLDTDAASLNLLYANNPLFNSIEILRIRINNQEDLRNNLDISRLEFFPNLKYVYFLCTFDICEEQASKSACEIGKISKLIIPEGSSKIKFFYLISIPS